MCLNSHLIENKLPIWLNEPIAHMFGLCLDFVIFKLDGIELHTFLKT